MNDKQITIIVDFCKKYNAVLNTKITEQVLREALKEVNASGEGLPKLLEVNKSYFSHEFIRKIPENIKKDIADVVTTGSWIRRIIKTYDRCPICNGVKNNINSTTCGYSCSNTHFRSGEDNGMFSGNNYRAICFSAHKKECIICKEANIVEVHHLDENNKNNDIKNLIPLCPTHHKYWHSSYKYLIEEQVNEYAEKFKNS